MGRKKQENFAAEIASMVKGNGCYTYIYCNPLRLFLLRLRTKGELTNYGTAVNGSQKGCPEKRREHCEKRSFPVLRQRH